MPALQTVARSTGARNLPVLANVLLQTKKGRLSLSATNLEVGVIKQVNAEVLEEGEITVPARTFLDVVSSLNNAKIELEGSLEQLKISSKNFTASLNGIPAHEFPSIPLSSDKGVWIDAKTLSQALPEITFAAAADEGRPILTGILTEIKKNSLELVATDGFRLAHKSSTIKTDSVGFKALIPRKTFEEVMRIIVEELGDLEDEKMEISTSENQNQMVFKIGQTVVSSRLIEGHFPSWEKIVPDKFITRVVLERSEAVRAVKLASVFARGDDNIIKIETEKDKLKLSSEAKQLGGQETEVEASVEGESVTIAFNSKYLLDALTSNSASQISIEFSGNLSPALIKPVGESGLEYVVMPIRLS